MSNTPVIEPGLLGYVAPSMFAGVVWLIGRWLLRGEWTARSAVRYYLWVLAFTVLNTVNYCSPGWCTTVGFPIPWLNASDVILENDQLGPFLEVAGAVLDLMTFVATAVALARLRASDRAHL